MAPNCVDTHNPNARLPRNQVIDYDRRRNSNREALRNIQKKTDGKSWVSLGDLFIKMPNSAASVMLKQDQTKLDAEIDEARERIKENTLKLEVLDDAEQSNRKRGTHLAGFDLRPITAQELYNVTKQEPKE
ncbi:hypothetical protein IWQ60_005755 [Tieghemiomyces parasiticus]|uniref:P53 and DNA damage-regulated protein 1 n=1 Tax=Tieghemiomyces parasiticus TaxID=78921 RepID=A0A9W8A5Q1_9FUNG|nr:hypothetical protein IWQ60_006362 [Tieghemiomyces parasiticus]KAJ1923645.1 hypothetical protein IWQ60_005755 [Tieghemiomyces parasiticus]